MRLYVVRHITVNSDSFMSNIEIRESSDNFTFVKYYNDH